MRPVPAFAVRTGLFVAAGCGISLGMDPADRNGVLLAALTSWPLQIALFGLLERGRAVGGSAFLVAWVGGMVGRLMLVASLGVVVVLRGDRFPPGPTLLSGAIFLFGMLMIESMMIHDRSANGIR